MPSRLIQHHNSHNDLILVQQLPLHVCYADHALVLKQIFLHYVQSQISTGRRDKRWHSGKQMSILFSISLPGCFAGCSQLQYLSRRRTVLYLQAQPCSCSSQTHTFSWRTASTAEIHKPKLLPAGQRAVQAVSGFYLPLADRSMLLLPFTPSIHMGKSVLSSYTKRSAHPHGDFFLWRKNVEITLRKVLLNEQQICIKRTITLQEWNP